MRFLYSLNANERDVFVAAGIARDQAPLSVVGWWDEVAGFAWKRLRKPARRNSYRFNTRLPALRSFGSILRRYGRGWTRTSLDTAFLLMTWSQRGRSAR